MNNTQFIEGIRFYVPNAKAPDFIKANFEIDKNELISFLNSQSGDKIRGVLKESKNGKYYSQIDTFEPSNQSNSATAQATAPVAEPVVEEEDDDLPF